MVIDDKLKMEFTFSKNIHRKETITKFATMYESALKQIITHCTVTEAGGFTPSDFSAAGLNQQELDNLLANLK
jgi:non-ribosomal peptide synthase protein (TIGR01720 family)